MGINALGNFSVLLISESVHIPNEKKWKQNMQVLSLVSNPDKFIPDDFASFASFDTKKEREQQRRY